MLGTRPNISRVNLGDYSISIITSIQTQQTWQTDTYRLEGRVLLWLSPELHDHLEAEGPWWKVDGADTLQGQEVQVGHRREAGD